MRLFSLKFPPTKSMSPKRQRQLTQTAAAMDKSDKKPVKTQATRTRTLVLKRESSPHNERLPVKRQRKLDGGAFLNKHLAEPKVQTLALQDVEEKALHSTVMKQQNLSDDETESGSTSSELRVEGKGRRVRGLRGKQKRQLKKVVDSKMDGSSSSFLEISAIGQRARENYKRQLDGFLNFVSKSGLETKTDAQMDLALVKYFNAKFAEGEGSYVGGLCSCIAARPSTQSLAAMVTERYHEHGVASRVGGS